MSYIFLFCMSNKDITVFLNSDITLYSMFHGIMYSLNTISFKKNTKNTVVNCQIDLTVYFIDFLFSRTNCSHYIKAIISIASQ